ncbi:MAG: thioredoxin domain-containing protein [Spirosomataceae bacterium]
MSNRLANETSPYLQQHAHNPVDWYPWSEEALSKAKTEDKPILVSIGYSACHWCHVMERESFENQQIAEIMNRYFVCIKVDREERPDVDAIYMDSLHAMGVRGGWPLNVFLMPDAKPFYGGTYFPPKNWANLLMSIQNAFVNNRSELQNSAEGFTQNMHFKESDKYQLSNEEGVAFSEDELIVMFNRLQKDFDTEKGGMNRAPKFPMPSIWMFLLRYYHQTEDQRALKQLTLTLDRVALGGIYDQVGGGWTRYSTDDEWKVPHFEKMLYDNGQLVSLYSEAFALTRNELYKRNVYQTIEWLEREMTSQEGGFYSALDADSEGIEGKYYIWTKTEIEDILGVDAEEFCNIFEFSEEGNWEHGYNIVHAEVPFPTSQNPRIEKWYQQLKEYRDQRPRPGLDNKILCSWNGLMLKGLVDAYKYFNEPKFLALALRNAQFIYENLTVSVQNEDGKEGRGLLHLYLTRSDGRPNPSPDGEGSSRSVVAFLEDYAAVIDAYIALYQVCFDEKWLREAEMLAEYTIGNFYDSEDEFFYFTDVQGEELIARKKEMFDNVIPASNSIMAANLYWLSVLLERTDFRMISDKMLGKMKKLILAEPQWLTNWACLASYHAKPTAEVVIVGSEISNIREQIDKTYNPNKVFVATQTASELPLLQGRTAINDQTTIYVCFDKTCQLPTNDVQKALDLIADNLNQ